MTDRVDERLVAALCRDGRADVPALAEALDATPRAVGDRLSALEDDGVIGGYTARVDYEGLGYRTAIVRLRVDRGDVDAVTRRLSETPAFRTVYETSGRFTVIAVGTFADEAAVAGCLRELHADPHVDGVACSMATTLREGDPPIPEG